MKRIETLNIGEFPENTKSPERPPDFEYFDIEKRKVPYVDMDGELQEGWHIINVYDLDSQPSKHMIERHRVRLEQYDGMSLDIGSPTFYYYKKDLDELGYPMGMFGIYRPGSGFGLYHKIDDPEKVTWLNLAEIQAEEGHQPGETA